jgi:hypothetical protein
MKARPDVAATLRPSTAEKHVDLYTATRHYFSWCAWNVLELDARDIAIQLGHHDGGELVRKLYGHPTRHAPARRVREAFKKAPPAPIPLVAASGLEGFAVLPS